MYGLYRGNTFLYAFQRERDAVKTVENTFPDYPLKGKIALIDNELTVLVESFTFTIKRFNILQCDIELTKEDLGR